MTFKILVLCTANICRSPVAQVVLNKLLEGKNVHIQSAGTRAIDGNRADPSMQMLMHERFPELANELSAHASRALMPSQISASDLILGMEQSHIDWVNKVQPIASGKTKLLSHWNGRLAIADPVGGSQSDYRAGFDLIVRESELWAQKIQQLGLC